MKKVKYLSFIVLAALTMSACMSQGDRTAEMLEKLEIGEIPAEVDVFAINTAASDVAWEGKKVTGSGHNGTLGVQSGEFYVYNGQLLGGKVNIDMTSIVVLDITNPDSNARLKGHLESDDFFSVATYPIATLEIASVEAIEGAAATHRITANLTIKDITHGVVFDANVNLTENSLEAVSSFAFDRSKYDVRFGSGRFFDDLGDNMIVDDINLRVNVVAGL